MTMTRRDAAKAVAAGMLMLKLPQDWMRLQTINMEQFCDTPAFYHPKFDLTRPYGHEGWTYATDARICFRTQYLMHPSDGESVAFPKAWEVLNWQEQRFWKPFAPKLVKVKGGVACPACRGIGRNTPDAIECNECVNGKIFDAGMNELKCETCRGTGYANGPFCDNCDATGQVEYGASIDDLLIAPRYAEILSRLNRVEVTRVRNPWNQPWPLLSFRCDEGEGYIAPIRNG